MTNGRRGRGLALLALTCAVALPVAACSSGSSGRPVANLPGHPGSSGHSGAPTTAQIEQDMVTFAHCMRAHGVQVPDPFHRPGHTGLSIETPAQTPANRPAFAACNHYIQPLVNMKMSYAHAFAAAHLPALTRYAQCMRSHDIPMLDPDPYGALNLGNVPGITSNFGRYSPQFRAADAACRHFLPAGVHDDGTGP